MAQFKLEDYFQYKNVTPSSLAEDNLILFSYRSPNGVHDKNPLVIVTERQSDRVYGINLHYTMDQLQAIVTNIQNDIGAYLEKEYFKKYPENKQKLNEERRKFGKDLITEAEYKEWMRRYPKKMLEQFQMSTLNKSAMRCYLYSRMTSVSKLTWKQ
jgi:hypothetical protein